jgi:L-threonylcarbamoyladenylate synthase
MRTIVLDPRDPDPAGVARAAEVLASGGLVAFPTETFYGLGADPESAAGLEALYRIKGRPESMPILLLLADEAQADAAAERTPPAFGILARRFWPGPLTLVVEARASLSARLTSGTGTIGMRVPSAAIPRALARALGRPITGTSANRTGAPPARRASEVVPALGMGGGDPGDAREELHAAPPATTDTLALLVDGGETPGGAPSTVVDLTGAAPRLVRSGAVAFAAVMDALGG